MLLLNFNELFHSFASKFWLVVATKIIVEFKIIGVFTIIPGDFQCTYTVRYMAKIVQVVLHWPK